MVDDSQSYCNNHAYFLDTLYKPKDQRQKSREVYGTGMCYRVYFDRPISRPHITWHDSCRPSVGYTASFCWSRRAARETDMTAVLEVPRSSRHVSLQRPILRVYDRRPRLKSRTGKKAMNTKYTQWTQPQRQKFNKKAELYRKDDRAMRNTYGCPENFRESLSTPTDTFPDIFNGLLFRSILWMCYKIWSS